MPVRIVRREWSAKNGVIITEKNAEFEARISKLVDEENWSIVSVLEEQEEGHMVDPVFILKQKIPQVVVGAKEVPLAQVEAAVADGWTVEALYAHHAVLKQIQKNGDHIDDALELLKQTEAK